MICCKRVSWGCPGVACGHVCLMCQKLEFSCSQFRAPWALLIVHPFTNQWLAWKQSSALRMDGPLLREDYSLRWISWRQGGNWMRLCNIYVPLPLYLALLWKEKYGHALECFDLQNLTSTSKVYSFSYPRASSAWCPKIICVFSLSWTTGNSKTLLWFLWNLFFLKHTTGPSELLAATWSLLPIMLKLKT